MGIQNVIVEVNKEEEVVVYSGYINYEDYFDLCAYINDKEHTFIEVYDTDVGKIHFNKLNIISIKETN